jgi:hypothetical protein
MVALLAVFPMRHKNLHALALGTTVRQVGPAWWVVLEADQTKAHRVDERPLPSFAQDLLERYLSFHRPQLLAGMRSHQSATDCQALLL